MFFCCLEDFEARPRDIEVGTIDIEYIPDVEHPPGRRETLRKEGESCGSCFCPTTNFTAGDCGPGLKCDLSIQDQIPDSPGTCKSNIRT